MTDYEKLGAFYLGRERLDEDTLSPEPLLYDAKDLTTHGVIVGMTGSGKTGLGVALLEEAAIDEVPAIVIDPKGDLGNLLLNFPGLKPGDFQPWIEKEQAARKGMTVPEYAKKTATTWKKGLNAWGQDSDRIQMLADKADRVIYTPGSSAGLQLALIKSLDPPPPEVRDNPEAFNDAITGAVDGLLTLLDITPDPLQSAEHILLSNILAHAWRDGRKLSLPGLIGEIQNPPFKKVGIMDLDAVAPPKERMALAMRINNVLASPGFAAWTQGEPLNVQRLLYTPEGKPRICVVSIAHLDDRERMFFVTILLNEILSWMRAQPGTSSLRALLYMDEVFGYLPPIGNPPTKRPLLTLLKQARAFGLGLVLATQNPVDLDYKALSNAGTWWLGRLQTQQDVNRVIEGLQGAAASAGQQFDRQRVEEILSGIGSRNFLMNNVHEDAPVQFEVRWVLSYLAGPMTREQISTLMADRKAEQQARLDAARPQGSFKTPGVSSPGASTSTPNAPADDLPGSPHKPVVTDAVEEVFLEPDFHLRRDDVLLYRPAVFAEGRLHFVDSKTDTDEWIDFYRLHPLEEDEDLEWSEADKLGSRHHDEGPPESSRRPEPDARYADLPAGWSKSTPYTKAKSRLKSLLYAEERLEMFRCPELKLYSNPGETHGDFKARLRDHARQERDLAVEKVRAKFEPKVDRLKERIRKAQQKIEEQQEQANSATMSAVSSVFGGILGAVFGSRSRGLSSTKVSTGVGRATRASKERSDVRRAEADKEEYEDDLRDLERDLEDAIDDVTSKYDPDNVTITPHDIKPRKSDIQIDDCGLAWVASAT